MQRKAESGDITGKNGATLLRLTLAELTRVVADHGHSLVGLYTALGKRLVQSRSRRQYLLMHVRIHAGSAIGKCCAPGHDVHVALLRRWHRPGRAHQSIGARGFAAFGTAVVADPRRIDTDAGEAGGLANTIVRCGSGPGLDFPLDFCVERLANRADGSPCGAIRDSLVQRQHFLEQVRDLSIPQIRCPLRLEVPQLRRHAYRQCLA